MSSHASNFDSLPDELVLEIVRHLQLVRKTSSTSSRGQASNYEDNRQDENAARSGALQALCLVNRHISGIATPILYSSFILDLSTRPDRCPTSLLLHTIIQKPHLAKNIQYIENRIEDVVSRTSQHDFYEWFGSAQRHQREILAKGCTLWESTLSDNETSWVKHFMEYPDEAEIALLIALSPNLAHLYLATVESFPPSIWDFIGFALRGGELKPRQYPRLKTLCIELEQRQDWVSGGEWFRQLASHLPHLPSLEYLHTNGMFCKAASLSLPPRSLALTSVYFSNTNLDLREICDFVSACAGLKHFACDYRPLEDGRTDFHLEDLRSALEKHKHTLESLYLDIRHVAMHKSMEARVYPLGPLTAFTSLRDLTLCTASLFGDPENHDQLDSTELAPYWNHVRPPLRISSLLPEYIERLSIVSGAPLQGIHTFRAWHDLKDDLIPNATNGKRASVSLKEVRIALVDKEVLKEYDWVWKGPCDGGPRVVVSGEEFRPFFLDDAPKASLSLEF
ncbi:hypothetical protein EJ04DRAFT_16430 [Polyplosphaeria fusca]|uniref:F-box domain-containing protein n=1 Tax=Polyplosphaeria fusca TaxID=682080 RepID=A0A9P4QP79_9PLEO|nr:hypothetical protein EJ04DRAFT_16430 [Polyplosphaeria fusca]